MFGLTLEEASSHLVVEVWPDNVYAVNVFISVSTQWRVGMNGAYGLDYNVLPSVMRMAGVPRAEWPEVFEGLRIMEDSALEVLRQRSKK